MKKMSLLICLLLISVFSFAHWTCQNPTPQGNELSSVYFTDANTAYSVGYLGTIIKTINGGTTWTALSSGSVNTLYSVYFANANTGYVVGDSGTILKTINGGTSWTTLISGTTNLLKSVCFTDVNTGYAIGAAGIILKTINGGTSWTVKPSGTIMDLYSVYFTDANTGYIGGKSGTMLKTINGGTSWTTESTGITNYIFSVYFTDANTGYAVGSVGKILKTIDGGTSWNIQPSGTTWPLLSVYFSDANTGYAVGGVGTILKTINGGTSWTAEPNAPGGQLLTSVCFTNANTGYAVGSSGSIVKTTNGGTTWTALSSSVTPWTLYSVFFTDVNTGYAVGDHTILKTINGGATWTNSPAGTNNYLQSVYFPDSNTGYAVGYFGAILKTIDGGASWVSLPVSDTNDFYSVFFTDANTGYAVGADDNWGSGVILNTIDGGTTWTTLSLYPSLPGFTSVYFTNANTGFAVDGYLFKTIDAGITWTTDSIWYGFQFINFPTANTGYALGGVSGAMSKTIDGGATWNTTSSFGTTNTLISVYFTDVNTGFGVGLDPTGNGLIIKTVNGGNTWTVLTGGTTNELFSVYFPDANTGYAVGGNGTIIKTSNGGFQGISGNVQYANSLHTAMNNVKLYVKNNQNVIIDSTFTNAAGDYQFGSLPPGNFNLACSTTKPWGGVNSTDALLIMEDFVQLMHLYNLNLLTADVDGNGHVNATDALYIAKRFTHQITSFPSGDWVFTPTSLTIPTSLSEVYIQALTSGDVNGSYIPAARLSTGISLLNAGEMNFSPGELILIPVKTERNLELGAASIIMEYPQYEFEILGIEGFSHHGELIFNTVNDQLRISWYSVEPLNLVSGDLLFTIKARVKSGANSSPVFAINCESELADATVRVIPESNLLMPKLVKSANGFSLSANYPNPFINTTQISYTLPEDGKVRLSVYNTLGEQASSLINSSQTSGTYQLEFDASRLPAGVYWYTLEVNGLTQDYKQTRKMTIVR